MEVQRETERATQWLMKWFLECYEDPVDVCPYESAEGGYQYVWGGPHVAIEVLRDTWGDTFTEVFLERVADRLETEQDCYEWSESVPEDADMVPCSVCRRLCELKCEDCQRTLCGTHAFWRRQERDMVGARAMVLCEAHATPWPGWVVEPFGFPDVADEEVPHDTRL